MNTGTGPPGIGSMMSGMRMKRFMVKVAKKILLIALDEIDWIQAEGNYMRLHCGKESFLIRRTMARLEAQLEGEPFVRVNRSVMVNVHRITELRLNDHSEYTVVLDNDRSWTWGRRFRANLEKILV
jgi:two-component system LytT family response regulator